MNEKMSAWYPFRLMAGGFRPSQCRDCSKWEGTGLRQSLLLSMEIGIMMNYASVCCRSSRWTGQKSACGIRRDNPFQNGNRFHVFPLKTSREPSLQRIRRRSHENRRPVKPVPDVDFARKRVRSKRSILPIRQRPIRKAVFPVCGALPYARRRQGASAVCCLQPAAWNWKRPAVVIKWTNCFCHNNTDWTL